MANKFNLPDLGFGIGLRVPHYSHILDQWPEMDWFEIVSENFMDTGGKPIRMLEKFKSKYPIVMHGVSMGIGTTDPTTSEYLQKLKKLADWVEPAWVSDHLCWTGVAHKNTHDLLPVPYTEEALKHIVQKIKIVQDYLERPLILENPSTYLEFKASEMPEWEFIHRMAEESNCGLLLDANNVYVTCYNHRLDPKEYIDALPMDRVVQIHLAGHSNKGNHIVDTHDDHVIDEVWDLYSYIISNTGPVSTMVEWDDEIPEFDVVKAEVEKARKIVENLKVPNDLPNLKQDKEEQGEDHRKYQVLLDHMQDAIFSGDIEGAKPSDWIKSKPDFTPNDQLDVYVRGYRYRLFNLAYDEYEVLRHYLGKDLFNKFLWQYIESHLSTHFNISRYIFELPEFSKDSKVLGSSKDINHKFATELLELETSITRVFDMKESKALDQSKFESTSPEELMDLKLLPREAMELFEFEHKVNDYFIAVKNEEENVEMVSEPSFLAVFRHNDSIYRLDLVREEFDLLSTLFKDNTVGEALETLFANDNIDADMLTTNLQSWFSKWISNGLFSDVA